MQAVDELQSEHLALQLRHSQSVNELQAENTALNGQHEALQVKHEAVAHEERQVEMAERRVQVKHEHKEQAAARADPDGVVATECVNLTEEEVSPPVFEETEETKACPKCRHRVTIPVDKVNCGWGHCMNCDTEFCWRCKAVGRKRRCRACN